MRFQWLYTIVGLATLVMMPTFRPTTNSLIARPATAAKLQGTWIDDDHDGIDDTTEQMLADRFAPIIFIEPDESNYPVNVDWFLQQRTHVEYHEDCTGDIDDQVSPEPIGSQQELLGPPWIGHAHCGEDDEGYSHPPHRDITTIAADPDGQKSDGPRTTGYSDQQTFVLPDLPDEVRVGSLDPTQWITYVHAYPTADGGIMLQYWHIFAYNEFSVAGFGRHGADWDATIHVQLAADLTLKGVWFSRHADDHPGTFLTGSAVYQYQATHPIMAIDGGGHAAFASPQDACANGSKIGSTVSWTTNLANPTDPAQLHIVNCAFPDLPSGRAGGTVWETWSGGHVRSAGELTHPLSTSLSSHGGMINLGEYNPCAPVTCNGSQQASTLLAGQFYPLNGQIFIRYEGRWGSLPHCGLDICANPPRGPVFQGWQEGDETHNGIYSAWYNQGSNAPADPITNVWRQAPATDLTLIGAVYRQPQTLIEYISGGTLIAFNAHQNASAAQFGVVQTYYRVFQTGQAPPPFGLYNGPFSLAGADGAYVVEYYSLDALRNQEPVTQQTFVKDSINPASTLTIGLPQYATTPVPVIPSSTKLTLIAEDAGSDVQSVSYRVFQLGTAVPAFTTQRSDTFQFTVNGPDGLYEIDTLATDNVGNVESTHTQIVRLSNTRIVDGLQALYTFEESAGATVHDVSGVGIPLDLTISDTAAVNWVPGSLVISQTTQLTSNALATRLTNAVSSSNELTIEAWVTPANVRQQTLARIMTLSNDRIHRNLELLQERDEGQVDARYSVRLRTNTTGRDGKPEVQTAAGVAIPTLQHVVYTRDALGLVRMYVDGAEKARAKSLGDFSNWDAGYRLVLANVLSGDRPWRGRLDLVALYNRAISPAEVSQNFRAGPDGAQTVAVAAKLQTLYTFEENGGPIVRDVSGSAVPLDLQASDPAAIQWVPGGLVISATTILSATAPATTIGDTARATGEVTFEAWVRPASAALARSGSIITVGTNTGKRSMALLETSGTIGHPSRYDARLRTSATSPSGTSIKTSRGVLTTSLTHIVYTRDGLGIARLYVNGVKQTEGIITGDFSRWEVAAHLSLANTVRGDQPWMGEYQLIAYYNRALSPADIRQRYGLGPNAVPRR